MLPPQLILTVHLLNFNWQDLTIGDFGYGIADLLGVFSDLYVIGYRAGLQVKGARLRAQGLKYRILIPINFKSDILPY